MDKIWIIVYDQVFVSQIISEITSLLVLNGRKKIHTEKVDRISQYHWWSREYWGEDWWWGQNSTLVKLITRSFENFKNVFLYNKKGTITLDKFHMIVRFEIFSKVKDLKILYLNKPIIFLYLVAYTLSSSLYALSFAFVSYGFVTCYNHSFQTYLITLSHTFYSCISMSSMTFINHMP